MKRNKVVNVMQVARSMNLAGAQQVAFNLAAGLNRSQYHVSICAMGTGKLMDKAKEKGIETVVFDLDSLPRIKLLWRMMRLVKSQKIDIIHSHDFQANLYAFLVAKLTRIPVFIATQHGQYEYILKKKKRVLMHQLMAKHTDTMTVVCKAMKRNLIEHLGVPSNKIKVIYNGIDSSVFDIKFDNTEKIRELGLKAGAPVVGTVANLRPVKGYNYLLEAVAHVLEQIPSTIFLIIGEGPLRAKLENQSREIGISQNVLFLGRRKDIPSLLKIMDVFVLPSLSEALSIATLEAMAARIAVITTAVGGNPEVVSDGQTGLLVAPKDPPALAQAIIRLLKNPKLAREMGMAGRKRVEDKFSLPIMLEKTAQLYEELLRGKNKSH